MVSFRWALVDIETTGLHVTYDEIIEIAVTIFTHESIERKWHSLVKPRRGIPDAISALTGITNEMVKDAPSFGDIAEQLLELLHERVFVAHNARFDFGFIKNAFKKVGLSYQAPVLCTIKLLKQMHPKLEHYNLQSIAQLFKLTQPIDHQAQADVETLYEIIQYLSMHYSWDLVLKQAKKIYQKSSIPAKLTTNISDLPNSPGVYIFYGDKNDLPLYIGKSITMRQRVLSHFSGDYLHPKEFSLSQQVTRVEVIPTAGELSALLLESELIKKHLPVYNRKLRRKKTLTGFKLMEQNGYIQISIVREEVDEEDLLKTDGIYGAFSSMVAVKRTLLQLIKTHELCPKLCGMERGNGACFSYQLKKCLGACILEEPSQTYNKRLMLALEEYREKEWPYKGAIAIKEYCSVNNMSHFILINQWRYLGTIAEEKHLNQWAEFLNESTEHIHTYDTYRIIYSYLNDNGAKKQLIELEGI